MFLFAFYPLRIRTANGDADGGTKNEESEKRKRGVKREEIAKEARRGTTLCWIFQKGNYKSRLETRGEVIKRNLYEMRRFRGSSLKRKK